jgi:hypothetical protein
MAYGKASGLVHQVKTLDDAGHSDECDVEGGLTCAQLKYLAVALDRGFYDRSDHPNALKYLLPVIELLEMLSYRDARSGEDCASSSCSGMQSVKL